MGGLVREIVGGIGHPAIPPRKPPDINKGLSASCWMTTELRRKACFVEQWELGGIERRKIGGEGGI